MGKKVLWTMVYILVFIAIAFGFFTSITDSGKNIRYTINNDSVKFLDGNILISQNYASKGVVYRIAPDGKVANEFLSSKVLKNSQIVQIAWRDDVYALLKTKDKKDNRDLYVFVKLDNKLSVKEVSGVYTFMEDAKITDLYIEGSRAYITAISSDAKMGYGYNEPIAFYEYTDETYKDGKIPSYMEEEILVPALYEGAPGNDIFVAGSFKDYSFNFATDRDVTLYDTSFDSETVAAFAKMNMKIATLLKSKNEIVIGYLLLLIISFTVLALIQLLFSLKRRGIYIGILITGFNLIICFMGLQISYKNVNLSIDENKADFAKYVLDIIIDEVGNPADYRYDDDDFYQSESYDKLRSVLSTYAGAGASKTYKDAMIVSTANGKILADARGYNGYSVNQIYSNNAAVLICNDLDDEIYADRLIDTPDECFKIFAVKDVEYGMSNYAFALVSDENEVFTIAKLTEYDGYKKTIIFFVITEIILVLILVYVEHDWLMLSRTMYNVARGVTNEKIPKGRTREINTMYKSVGEIEKRLEETKYSRNKIFEAYYRFAPKSIEKILGKSSITEVSSNDYSRFEATLVLLDTGLAKKEQLDEMMEKIGEYQEEGSAVMVSTDSDISKIRLICFENNNESSSLGIDITSHFDRTAVILHRDEIKYGIVGNESQSQPYILSDDMTILENYLAWLRTMNVKLVCTENVVRKENLSESVRYIGYITHEGKKIDLYENLFAASEADRKGKQDTLAKFQEGLKLYNKRDFYFARNAFTEVFKRNPLDLLAKWYVFACESYLDNPMRAEELGLNMDLNYLKD